MSDPPSRAAMYDDQSPEPRLNDDARGLLDTAEKLRTSLPGTADGGNTNGSCPGTPPHREFIEREEKTENPRIAKYFPTVINMYEIPQRPTRFRTV